jgi:mycothione reductase
MKEYDLIIIGTGSAMNLVEPFLKRNPEARIAVIDKDQPGGICLTRGCIPSKLLVYPAELVELARRMPQFGLDVVVRRIDFAKVMERMREHVHPEGIRRGLTEADQLDYYHDTARFTAPYTLRVGAETLHSRFIILCTGSEAVIPPIEGIEDVDYLTSDTLLALTRLPSSLLIVGGGYIAAEYGHFFAAMGSEVTVVGRNPQFLPNEEPEVSDVALRMLGRRMRILTNHEAVKVAPSDRGATLWARDRATDRRTKLDAEALLIAAGRGPTSRHLSPEKGGIQTTEQGWIEAAQGQRGLLHRLP